MFSIIIILFSLILYQCKGSLEKEIPFSDISKVPIIKAKLNNKDCYLMIDTGASISILDIAQIEKYNFKLLKYNNDVLGVGGKSKYYELRDVNVKIDSLNLNNSFKGNNLNDLVKIIELNSGLTIVGILGSDVFKEQGFKIDYLTNSIRY